MAAKHTILDMIPEGRENAVSMADLARVLKVEERQIRKIVFDARIDGTVICGTAAGYYKPATEAEIREYIAIAGSRSISGLKALRAARKKLSEMRTVKREKAEI